MAQGAAILACTLIATILHTTTAQNVFGGMFGDQGLGGAGMFGGNPMGMFQGAGGLGQAGGFPTMPGLNGNFPGQGGGFNAGTFGFNALNAGGGLGQTAGLGGMGGMGGLGGFGGFDTAGALSGLGGFNALGGGFSGLGGANNLGGLGGFGAMNGLGGLNGQMQGFGSLGGGNTFPTTGFGQLGTLGQQFPGFGGLQLATQLQLGSGFGAGNQQRGGNNAAPGVPTGMGGAAAQDSMNIFTDPTTGQRVRIIPRAMASNVRISRTGAPSNTRNVAGNNVRQFVDSTSGRRMRVLSRDQASSFVNTRTGIPGRRHPVRRPGRPANNMRAPVSQTFMNGQQLASLTGLQVPRALDLF